MGLRHIFIYTAQKNVILSGQNVQPYDQKDHKTKHETKRGEFYVDIDLLRDPVFQSVALAKQQCHFCRRTPSVEGTDGTRRNSEQIPEKKRRRQTPKPR